MPPPTPNSPAEDARCDAGGERGDDRPRVGARTGGGVGAVAEQHPDPEPDEQRSEGVREVASGDSLLEGGAQEDAADRGNADQCRPREVDLALDRVERGSHRRRDQDRGEGRAGCLVGRESREHHQQWNGDDAAADAEQRAEQACDQADGDDLEQAGAEPPRRGRRIGARGNRGAVVLGSAHACTWTVFGSARGPPLRL